MSRLIDKLTRQRQVEPRPIGFMVNSKAAEKPHLQLIALYNTENQEKVSSGLGAADAVLVEISKDGDIDLLDKACQAKDSVPTGGWLKTTNAGTLKKLIAVACDFVAFPAAAPLTVTQKEKMGRVLEVDASLNDVLLRTVNDLPVDAILFSEKADDALTLNRLMSIQRLIYLTNKPVLVPVSGDLTSYDLQALWDMGVGGVVVEVTDEKSAEKLAELHKTVENLNAPAFRKKAKWGAIVPRMQADAEQHQEDDGGEEEEDE